MAVILDTSGGVWMPPPQSGDVGAVSRHQLRWPDLDPFTQGYVAALFADSQYIAPRGPVTATHARSRITRPVMLVEVFGFSDLAPEALALILKDCGEFTSRPFGTKDITDLRPDREAGSRLWIKRRERFYDAFPPLTPTLSDDGKVHLREAA